jgi:hypothetical protein
MSVCAGTDVGVSTIDVVTDDETDSKLLSGGATRYR